MNIDLEYEIHDTEKMFVRNRCANIYTMDGHCVKEFTIRECKISSLEELSKLRQMLDIAQCSLERYHNTH